MSIMSSILGVCVPLIRYLKALMVVLRHAQAQELVVVHGHSHQLDGTEN